MPRPDKGNERAQMAANLKAILRNPTAAEIWIFIADAETGATGTKPPKPEQLSQWSSKLIAKAVRGVTLLSNGNTE